MYERSQEPEKKRQNKPRHRKLDWEGGSEPIKKERSDVIVFGKYSGTGDVHHHERKPPPKAVSENRSDERPEILHPDSLLLTVHTRKESLPN
jgi:hypothetical protein